MEYNPRYIGVAVRLCGKLTADPSGASPPSNNYPKIQPLPYLMPGDPVIPP